MTYKPARPDNEVIYGIHSVAEALKNTRRRFVRLLATQNAAERLKPEILSAKLVAEIVLPKLLDRLLEADAVHQGLLLEAQPLAQPRLDEIRRDGLVVVLDQVTDPHNVGAIMRSCAAFGASALITTARHSAATSGVLFKAASGAYEHVPYVKVTNLARALDELRDYGFMLVGLDSKAPLALADASLVLPLGLVLGAEGKGLRQLTRDTCDAVARLALPGAIISLNVSNATAVALYAVQSKLSEK
jgi:23S rRNA (guanosine2251-2'-O)-methyltransferase